MFVVCCVGDGPCDQIIPRVEKFYHVKAISKRKVRPIACQKSQNRSRGTVLLSL